MPLRSPPKRRLIETPYRLLLRPKNLNLKNLNLKSYSQNKSNSLIEKFSGACSSTYKIVYSMLNLITLHVGNSLIGSWANNEKPSKRNSCWSYFMMVGVLVRKFVGGEIVILKNQQNQ